MVAWEAMSTATIMATTTTLTTQQWHEFCSFFLDQKNYLNKHNIQISIYHFITEETSFAIYIFRIIIDNEMQNLIKSQNCVCYFILEINDSLLHIVWWYLAHIDILNVKERLFCLRIEFFHVCTDPFQNFFSNFMCYWRFCSTFRITIHWLQ